MNWQGYQALQITQGVPPLTDIVLDFLKEKGRPMVRDDIVHHVSAVTGIDRAEVQSNITTPLSALKKSGDIERVRYGVYRYVGKKG